MGKEYKTSQPLSESLNAQVSDDCTNQTNQRISRRENVPYGEAEGRTLCTVEASELSHEEVRVEKEDDKTNFCERSQGLF
jgi:hypothetical protein